VCVCECVRAREREVDSMGNKKLEKREMRVTERKGK
jgi:hypothetical protein